MIMHYNNIDGTVSSCCEVFSRQTPKCFLDPDRVRGSCCFKGGIGITNLKKFENELGKIILGRLEPGATIGLHTHETNSEAIYIISGTADFIYDPDAAADKPEISETVSAGGCHYCPKGHTHSMVNNSDEDIVFFAVIPEQ